MRRLFAILLSTMLMASAYATSGPATALQPVDSTFTETRLVTAPSKARKLNFIQRWAVKTILKKAARMDEKDEANAKQLRQGRISMILGISSLVLLFTPAGILAIPAAIVGLIFGLKSIKGNSNGPGIAGVVTSSVTLVLLLIVIILVAAILSGFGW